MQIAKFNQDGTFAVNPRPLPERIRPSADAISESLGCPSLAMVLACPDYAGYVEYVEPGEYNPDTHKLGGGVPATGGAWTREIVELTAEEKAARLPRVTAIDMRQCRRQLVRLGVYEAVNTAVAGMDVEAQIDWEYATTVLRDNELVIGISAMMGWREADTDGYFLAASKL